MAIAPIIVTSFPKSGLHLLAQMMRPLAEPSPLFGGYYSERQMTTHENGGWGPGLRSDTDVLKDLNDLQDGEQVWGHLAAIESVAGFLEDMGWPVIFLHRDLRDVAVSMAYHIESDDDQNFPHPRKWTYRALPSHERRIQAVIEGYAGWPSLRDWYRQYAAWERLPWVLTLTYGMLRGAVNASAIRILEYLRERTGEAWSAGIEDDMVGSILTSGSPTFRAGRVGDWEQEFDGPLRTLAERELA